MDVLLGGKERAGHPRRAGFDRRPQAPEIVFDEGRKVAVGDDFNARSDESLGAEDVLGVVVRVDDGDDRRRVETSAQAARTARPSSNDTLVSTTTAPVAPSSRVWLDSTNPLAIQMLPVALSSVGDVGPLAWAWATNRSPPGSTDGSAGAKGASQARIANGSSKTRAGIE